MASVLALTVAYDGSGFAGFARQPNQTTVQGRLESALAVALRRDVETVGAGRTDAGVHALGQVVSFEAEESEVECSVLLRSLNALVGEGIVVTGIHRMPTDFSARHSALAREYRYRIATGAVPPLFVAPYSWWVREPLDLDAMREAAAMLIGEHDFTSFCVAASAVGKPTSRRLEEIVLEAETALGEDLLVIRVTGNAFLHSMVRVIAGSLVEVGAGRRPPSWMGEALAARDRAAAGPTAPASGLTLWRVVYPAECGL